MKSIQLRYIKLGFTSMVVLVVGGTLVLRDYIARADNLQNQIDWATHPLETALGLLIPILVLAPIFYWYLGRAKWFQRFAADGENGNDAVASEPITPPAVMAPRLIMVAALLFGVAVAILIGWSSLFGPKDFMSCLVAAAKTSTNEGSLRILAHDCRSRFPEVQRPAGQ